MDNIKNIIPTVIEQLTMRQVDELDKIQRVWKNIVPVKLIPHAAIEGFRDGTLSVCVDSSVCLFQFNCEKRKILDAMKEEVGELTKIVFKIGKVK